jgi:hypothetical protein
LYLLKLNAIFVKKTDAIIPFHTLTIQELGRILTFAGVIVFKVLQQERLRMAN